MGIRALLLLLGVTLFASCQRPEPPADADTVVLLHGLGRTSMSMAFLGYRLEGAGYRVVHFEYPSTEEPIDSLTARLSDAIDACCGEDRQSVHFVTHSLGGILVRSYLTGQAEPHRGRVVMLSPPSEGSEIVDAFSGTPLLPLLLGPAGSELGTDSSSVPARLEPADFSLGVIMGYRSLDPLGSLLIPGADDGKVAVHRALASGTDDFLLVPATHTFIMNRQDVADQTIHFLEQGRFAQGERGSS